MTAGDVADRTLPASLSAQLLIHICRYMTPGVWYDWQEVVKAVTPRVPRSVAGRRGYAEWERGVRRRRPDEDPPPRDIREGDIRSGARTWIRWAVDNVEGVFEWRGKVRQSNRQIRLVHIPPHIRDYVKHSDQGQQDDS